MPSKKYLNFLRRKNELISDTAICEENRTLFLRFFEFEEYKLKRRTGLPEVDDKSVHTLEGYIPKLRNANQWFGNKPWSELTAGDIKRVYDGLEDGQILTERGRRFLSRTDYYNKIFKSKPFALAGKAVLAKEVISYAAPADKSVRFVREEEVRKVAHWLFQPKHRLLVWLAFDIGENINSLLVLRPKDFARGSNPATGEPEYRVQLRREILKRSRTPRSEITNYRETVDLLDDRLKNLQPDEPLFEFGYRSIAKVLSRAASRAGVKCEPNGQGVTWKDLRSGMACDLLRKGWSTDEVKARLGHRPSSREIDKYVNYLALDRHRPKAKVQQFEVTNLQAQLEESRNRERLHSQRLVAMEERMEAMYRQLADAVLSRNPRLSDVEDAIAFKAGAVGGASMTGWREAPTRAVAQGHAQREGSPLLGERGKGREGLR